MKQTKKTHVVVLIIKGTNADGTFKQLFRRFAFEIGLTFEEINAKICEQLSISDRYEVVNIFEY